MNGDNPPMILKRGGSFVFELITYQTPSGKRPIEKFLSRLDRQTRIKVKHSFDALKERGNTLRPPLTKLVRDGIYELRIQVGNNHTRILYFFYSDKRIVLTNGFTKKTNRTPPKELALALKFKADFEKRF